MRRDESGAVAVIVVLTIIVLFAFVVLTVDVGGLLLERRAMVNASDAAALAAAQSCANESDATDPEDQADEFAKDNVSGVPADGITNITEMVGCDTGSGHVTVHYSEQHRLFFANVIGLGNQGTITTEATAAWGPLAGGFAIPIVLQSGYVQGTCKIPDGIEIGDTCAFWYDNGDTTGEANWGYMNLDLWNVSGNANCHSAGSSDRGDWIGSGYPDIRTLNGDPPGTAPTYVCNDTGHSTSNWQDLTDQEGQIKLFPVNDCDGQLDKNGNLDPCPATPDKYDIIGFTSLLIQHVYRGDETAAIGTQGASGTCTKTGMTIPAAATLDLDTILQGSPNSSGCPSVPSDTVPFVDVHVFEDVQQGNEYVKCAPGAPGPCDYVYDESTHVITWLTGSAPDKEVVFGWSMNGTPGACGEGHVSDPNAICLVTEWRGFTTGPGPIGGGTNFGPTGIKLCELDYSVGCPDQG